MDNGDVLVQLVDEDFGIKGTGRWYRSDVHSSLVIDREKGVFYFNASEPFIVGGPIDYLTKVRGLPFNEAKTYLKSRGFTDTVVLTITPHDQEDVVVYPKLVEVLFENGREDPKGREYWKYWNLTDDTIDRFQLGYYNGWYTFPIFVDGTLRQIQKRREQPKKEIARWYKGVPPLLVNSDILRIVDKIFIVEGPKDLLSMMQAGLPTVCCDTGAETWLNDWFFKFIRCKEIYCLLDRDVAGDVGSIKIARSLGETRTKIYNFWGFDKGFSPSYFFRDGGTKDQLLGLVDKYGKYVFEMETTKRKNK